MNNGWNLITNQLNHERVALAPPGMVEQVYEDTVAWARETKLPDGRRVIDQDWVQLNLARVHAQPRVPEAPQLEGRHLRRPQSRRLSTRRRCSAPSSSSRRTACCWRSSAGRHAAQAARRARRSRGRLERAYQGTLFLTFGGGTNEIQRDLIAMFGLGMPRVPR